MFSFKNQTSQSVFPCIAKLLSHRPISTCPHRSFSPSLASFTSLHPPSLFPLSSPQQLINAAPSPSIIRAAFLLYFPSHTAREQHFPCIPCTTSINLLPKMIKSTALINECDGWINSRTLISESSIHTKYTTLESLFGHSLSGYICHLLRYCKGFLSKDRNTFKNLIKYWVGFLLSTRNGIPTFKCTQPLASPHTCPSQTF